MTPTPQHTAISAKGPRKAYGGKTALDGIDLDVPEGTVIAVLDGGKLVAQGTADELKRRLPGGHVLLRFTDPGQLVSAARVVEASSLDPEALTLQVAHDGGVHELRTLLARLDDARVEVDRLTVHTPDLDDVFFALTGSGTSAGLDDSPKETVR